MRFSLLLAGCLGFASGILCRSLFVFPWPALLFGILLGLLCLFSWFRRPRMQYLWCTVAILAAVLGAGRVLFVPQALPDAYVSLVGEEVVLEGIVTAEPDMRETSQRVLVRTPETNVLAVAPLYPAVSYGERVRISGKLVLPEPFDTDGGRVFRYDRFLAKDGIFTLVERASLETIAPAQGMGAQAMQALIAGKRAFQGGLAQALPEPAASLASGLITGGKQGLGTSLLDAFIAAGLVHIVVLSGYNVMIVAEGVLRVLGFLGRRRAALAAGITIALFVLAAGAGAASVRAGLMAGLALLARATGRTYDVVRALLVAGVLMLLWNPLLLAFDPGFQLSFMATLGLVLGAPVVEGWIRFVRSDFWRELLSATLAAQIAVLPLLLFQTGLLSAVALPANLLVLPAVPLAMALSALAGLAGILLPTLAPLLGLPAYALLSYITGVAEFMSALPHASIVVPRFSFLLVLLAYGALVYGIAKAPAHQIGTRAQMRIG